MKMIKIRGIVVGILTGAYLPIGIRDFRYFKLSRPYLVLIKNTLSSLNIRGCQQPVLHERSQIQKYSVFQSVSQMFAALLERKLSLLGETQHGFMQLVSGPVSTSPRSLSPVPCSRCLCRQCVFAVGQSVL